MYSVSRLNEDFTVKSFGTNRYEQSPQKPKPLYFISSFYIRAIYTQKYQTENYSHYFALLI